VFFWLVVIGAIMLVGTIGCCGGLFLILPGTKWQTHESKDGGFKVELPTPPQPDVAQAAGLKLENGTRAEGTIRLRRAEKFLVVYRDIKSTKERGGADEQELDARVEKIRNAMQAEQIAQTKEITIAGFPGREIAFQAKTGWHMARVVVADTRVYIVLAGGGMAQPGDPDLQRFLDSFEITDAKLVAEGKRRAEQAKLAAEAVREAKERAAKRAAEPPPEPELDPDDVHGAAEAVAEAALAAAEKARPPVRRLPVAPPPRPVDGE
jgi:hypothetical protein